MPDAGARRSGPDDPVTIDVGQKPQVEVDELPLGAWPATQTVPPISVSIYVLPLR